MGRVLEIRRDVTAVALRARARRERNNRAARRRPAIANALDGMARAKAAESAGMERQALRDAIVRYDAEGLAGLCARPTPGRPPAPSEAEIALLSDRIFRGPDPEKDGVGAWTLPDLRRWIEARFDGRLSPQSLSRILRREGFSRQKTRPTQPKTDEAARRRFERRGRGAGRGGRGASRPARDPPVPGRAARRPEGSALPSPAALRPPPSRPTGPALRRPCVFGAARPDGEAAFGLVMPEVNPDAMQAFLDAVAATLDPDEHAVTVLDRAGWHGARALEVPPNVTLAPLPPCSPQLDPMERVCLYLRERFLSLRVFPDYDAIVDACSIAWNAFADDAGVRFLETPIRAYAAPMRRSHDGRTEDGGRACRSAPDTLAEASPPRRVSGACRHRGGRRPFCGSCAARTSSGSAGSGV